jgi:hypothetical protein
MQTASALRDRCKGEAVAVLGGGPSLPGDVELVLERRGPVIVAVKQHGLYLQHELGFLADYVCFLENPDDPAQGELRAALRLSPDVMKVSPFYGWSDVDFDVPWWQGGFSSTLAVWLAGWMGASEILLCGMDCYQGHKKYHYPRPGYHHPCFESPLEAHLAAWRPALDLVPNAERIRTVSGPLVGVFGRWEA